jgi:hypothetical protein
VTIAEPEPDTIRIVEVCNPGASAQAVHVNHTHHDRMGEVAARRSDRRLESTRAIPYLITRRSLSISTVFSIGRASTVCPLPVIVVALNIELYTPSQLLRQAALPGG